MYKEEDPFGLHQLLGLLTVFIANTFLLKNLNYLELSFYGHKEIQKNASLSVAGLCTMHAQGKPVPLPLHLFGIGRGGIKIANILELGNLTSSLHSAQLC